MQESKGDLTWDHYLSSPPIEPSLKEFAHTRKIPRWSARVSGHRGSTQPSEPPNRLQHARCKIFRFTVLFCIYFSFFINLCYNLPYDILRQILMLFARLWKKFQSFRNPQIYKSEKFPENTMFSRALDTLYSVHPPN